MICTAGYVLIPTLAGLIGGYPALPERDPRGARQSADMTWFSAGALTLVIAAPAAAQDAGPVTSGARVAGIGVRF